MTGAGLHVPTGPQIGRSRSALAGRAFSLVELMIAIVILGLGMVMIATMFPVAMARVRVLTDETRKTAIVSAAESAVVALTHVDASSDALGYNASSFAGDMILHAPGLPGPSTLLALSDSRVHLLHMENLLVGSAGAPRRVVPDRLEPWFEDFAPWHLDGPDFFGPVIGSLPLDFTSETDNWCAGGLATLPGGFCGGSFFAAQVRIDDRVYPPMRARTNVTPAGVFDEDNPAEMDDQWDNMFSSRKYAWAVLHRLDNVLGPERDGVNVPLAVTIQQAVDAAASPRKFTMYYVALRRPQSTQRFARQDPQTAPNVYDSMYTGLNASYLMESTPSVVPAALPPEDDVLLPEPWRVQVQFPDTVVSGSNPLATGIPTEIEVPPPSLADEAGANAAEMVMLSEMIQKGAEIIDEVNGQVYRVARRRLKPAGDGYVLTLDREITVEDLEDKIPQDLTIERPCDNCQFGLDPEERLRTVWVFPPPVLAQRSDDGIVVFDGPQPVIGIEIRTMTIGPKR